MKRMDLNFEYDKLNDDQFLGRSYLMKKMRKIHDNGMVINDFYWQRFDSIDDKAISMTNIRFVNYCDLYNNLIKPFKKGY